MCTSTGHRAAKGTKAVNRSVCATIRLPSAISDASRSANKLPPRCLRACSIIAAVLEAAHLLHARRRQKVESPVSPRVDNQTGVRLRQFTEGPGVVAGEADNLTPPDTGHRREAGRHRCHGPHAGQTREAVLEDDDVVVGRGHLAGPPRRPGAQRALVRRRLVGPVLSARGDDHPLPRRLVEPQLRLPRLPGRQRPAVNHRRRGVAGQRKEKQLAAIGQRRSRAHWVPSWSLCQSRVQETRITQRRGWPRVLGNATALYERARNWTVGSDPGLLRLRLATRTTGALATALLALFLLTKATGQPLTVALLGVLITMISARSVNDRDPRRQRITMA